MRPQAGGPRFLYHLRLALVVVYSALVLYYFMTGWEGATRFTVLMVPFSVTLWVVESIYRGEPLVPRVGSRHVNVAVGSVLALMSLVSGYYIYTNFWDLVSVRMGSYNQVDLLMGALIAAVILWFGAVKYPIIFAIVAFFLVNALYGRYFPGILRNPGVTYTRLVSALSVDFSTGVFESLSQLALTVISAFMLFVGFLSGFGLVDSTNRIVLSKLRRPRLIPLTNILVGVPVGMVTGSAGAATATVGSLTVPIVQRLGVPLAAAAAMAAAAGVGAQLMPPVMGAAAFVMADALGVPYFDVAIRGFVPALAYFAGLALAVYLISARTVKAGEVSPRAADSPGPQDYANLGLFAIGIATLVALMATWMYAPIAALRSAALVLAGAVAVHLYVNRGRWAGVVRGLGVKLVRSLEFFVVETANLTLLLALLGVLKALFTITGLSLKLGTAIVSAGAGNLYVVTLLSYAFGYIVGMGVPPLGTYVIVYPVVVPALMRLGVRAWAAQFTAFFLAVHAEFAPPMSVSAATISRIARVSFTSVLRELVKLGIGMPLLALVTPLKPELVLEPGINQVLVGLEVATAMMGLGAAGYGSFHSSRYIDLPVRLLLAIGSLVTIFARGLPELLGLAVVVPLLAYAIYNSRKAEPTGRA
jgi:TRAP transporter 4TM/12TM fusion protein